MVSKVQNVVPTSGEKGDPMNERYMARTWTWLTCVMIVCCAFGCEGNGPTTKQSAMPQVAVNGSGNEVTVSLSASPPFGKQQSRGTWTSVTETHSGKEYLGQSYQGEGQTLKVIARADPTTQGLEIIVDSPVKVVVRATYERSDGTVSPWTRQVEPGRHVIRLP